MCPMIKRSGSVMFTIRRSMKMIAALHKRFGRSKVSEVSNPGV